MFCDVQEDFWEVKKVLSRFNEWRVAFSESYHSAYISLCLPKLLNPLIRHQLLGWNPLQVRYTHTHSVQNPYWMSHSSFFVFYFDIPKYLVSYNNYLCISGCRRGL